MPIYEFYCPGCHTLYNFFSSRVRAKARPECPAGCGQTLEKRPARFAMIKRSAGDEIEDEDLPFDHLDESQMEAAFETLAHEMEGLDESEDPRTVSRALRRFGELTGLEPGPRMEEMLARLESGEDLDALEEGMEDDLGDEEDLSDFFRLKRALLHRRKRPRVDQELYFFED